MHPLCLTIIRHPDLVLDHLSAYAALLTQEASDASQSLVNRVMVWLAVVIFGSIGMVLAGTALMLGILQNQFHWILVVVPAAMMLCSLIALLSTKQALFANHFSNIKSQFSNDTKALRIAAGHETL